MVSNNSVLLKKYKVQKVLPNKDIPTVTNSCISAHCAEFTLSQMFKVQKFGVEKILIIVPSSPLYCALSNQKIRDIINIIFMRYSDVQELEYYGSDGNKLVTDDDKDLVVAYIYYHRY